MTQPLTSERRWRNARRVAQSVAEPGEWRSRLAHAIHAACEGATISHVAVVTCSRNEPGRCEYGYYPHRHVDLADLLFSWVMPRLLGDCRATLDWALARHGNIMPGLSVLGRSDPNQIMREACAGFGVTAALLGCLWDDDGLVGYILLGGTGDELALLAALGPDLSNIVQEAQRMLSFAARLAAESQRAQASAKQDWNTLSRRERDVARLVTQGFSDANVAAQLDIAEATVGTHLHRIYRKLDVHSRVDLVRRLGRPPEPAEPTITDLHMRAALAFARAREPAANTAAGHGAAGHGAAGHGEPTAKSAARHGEPAAKRARSAKTTP